MHWINLHSSTKRIQPARGWCVTVPLDCIHLILPLRRPGPPVVWGSQSCDPAAWLAERQLLAGDIESNPGPKPAPKTLLHTLTQSPTLTNSPVQPSQSSPSSLSPSSLSPAASPPNSPTSVQSPLPPLQNTPTYHRASIQLHTLIYLKQHTGPLDVSREGSASASQVERTPGRATLNSWVVGPLHSYTQEGWVDNNHNLHIIMDKLLCGRIRGTSLGEITSRPETEYGTKQCMQSRHMMPETNQCRRSVFASWNCLRRDVCARPNRKPMRPTLYMDYVQDSHAAKSRDRNGGTSNETPRVSAVWQQKIPHT